jgi:Domain of unknown function (DUF5122) beta-propeller
MRAARLIALSALLVLAIVPAVPADAGPVSQPTIVSSSPAKWTPWVDDGKVLSIVQVGNEIVAAGSFTTVQQNSTSPQIPVTNIFAFNATTGTIDPGFDPTLNGVVNALATDGTNVFLGGTFTTVNGQTVNRIAKLDMNGNPVTGFKASTSSSVQDLDYRGGTLYAGGHFTKINGKLFNKLAAINGTTGAPLSSLSFQFTVPRQGTSTSIEALSVSPDGRTLIAIGNFTQVDGQDRQQAAMIDLSTSPATLANWRTTGFAAANCSTGFDTYMRDVDFAPDSSYFVVVTTGAYRRGLLCDTSTRWETSARGQDLTPSWVDYTGGDTQWSVAVTGTAIYTGGHQRWENNPYLGDSPGPGAVPRSGIAGLDPENGLPFTWNPGRTRGVGAFALVPTAAGLWVGSDTEKIGGSNCPPTCQTHKRIAFFPLSGGAQVPHVQPGSLPGNLYAVLQNGTVVRRSFDGSTLGAPTTVNFGGSAGAVRGGFMIGNRLYTGNGSGGVDVRVYANGAFGSPSTVNLYGLTNSQWHLANQSGMFYDGAGRMYATVSGESQLRLRYFSQQSDVFGACPTYVTASPPYCGIENFITSTSSTWSTAQGITLANGNLYWTDATGQLFRAAWNNANPATTGTPVVGASFGGPVLALFVGP